MIQYLKLQAKIGVRSIHQFGVHPVIGIPILIVTFVFGSFALYSKFEYATYLYPLLGILSVLRLGNQDRNAFLKSIFKSFQYIKVRSLENMMALLPFVLFQWYKLEFWESGILLMSGAIVAQFPHGGISNFTIPTPFFRWPFEFTVGFRMLFWLCPLAFFVTYMSVHVGNLNLGIFGMELIFLISMLFYFVPEPVFYFWADTHNSYDFLIQKIGIAMLYSSFLALPIFAILFYFFPGNEKLLITFLALGYGYLVMAILLKYSSYPKKISLPQALLLGYSLYYPFIILFILPILFAYVHRRLKRFFK